MKLKQIGIILILLVIFPALFYTAYEFSALNENERLITEIYDQQLSAILFSVNQHAWDRANNWVGQINIQFLQPPEKVDEGLDNFLRDTYALEAIIIADSALQEIRLFKKDSVLPKNMLVDFLKSKRTVIDRLFYRKTIGYTKIESFEFSADTTGTADQLLLLFVSDEARGNQHVVGIILNTQQFIDQILAPKIGEYASQELVVGVFESGKDTPAFQTDPITAEQVRQTKRIWLFPDHYLGIKLKGAGIEDIARARFYRSLQLIFILDIILIIGVVIVYRNIRRQMELARMKNDFVSNVSHELRTPLALIRMFAETLEMDRVKDREKQKEYYRIIGQETERLTHLINNILDFSRMEAGKKKFQPEPVNLNDIVKKNLDFYQFHLQNKGFELEKDITGQDIMINGDDEALSEALINLLDNAVKYSADEKQIRISTAIKNESAVLEVADKGIGITEKEQKRIFEKFYRVSEGLQHNTKGSGLGLALVSFTMKAHKGKIEVESSPGKGSVFRLIFPLLK